MQTTLSLSPLTEELLGEGIAYLSQVDPDLALLAQHLGPPPLWAREPGFPTLLHIILEQQVSLASAKATYDRLRATLSPLTPSQFLTLDEVTLKQIGFSRQKTRYSRLLAQALVAGELDLELLAGLADEQVRAELTNIKGIGSWTANIYLLLVLRRPDIWPSRDLALAVAVQKVKKLPTRPTPTELEEIAQPWRPWRAVAARLLWHDYLSRKRG
jgi:DNA-3-methyladenine glycosylase II